MTDERKCIDHGLWSDVNLRTLLRPDWQRCGIGWHRWVGFGVSWALLNVAVLPLLFFAGAIADLVTAIESRAATVESGVSPLAFIAFVVLIIPLDEEAIFRWPRTHRPRTYLCLPAVVATAYSAARMWRPEPEIVFGPLSDVAILGIGIGLHLLGGKVPCLTHFDHIVGDWWQRRPAVPVWMLISAFTLSHLTRFDIQWNSPGVLAIPLILLPWFWSGIVLSTARIRFGWWQAVGLHASGNLLTALVILR